MATIEYLEAADIWIAGVGGIRKEKELTPRQIREQAEYEAEKTKKAASRPRETAFDRRNFYRKQAGWPLLKVK